jgi:tRNA-2-methylthio-N6-dimethylallyladenosine synthase
MAAQGMTATDDANAADLVVLNTCHIREKATEKVYSDIGRLRKTASADDRGRRLRRAGRRRRDRAPRQGRCRGRPAGLSQPARSGRRRPRAASRRSTPTCRREPSSARCPRARPGPIGFLTVQEGCDKFCTYCVVPYTRGAEVSRPWAAIVDEAKALVDAGAREITCSARTSTPGPATTRRAAGSTG